MGRQLSLIILALFLGMLGSLLIFIQVQAQIDAFTYFIPYYPDDLNAQFNVNNAYTGTEVTQTISISILRDDTIIYFDVNPPHHFVNYKGTLGPPGSTEVSLELLKVVKGREKIEEVKRRMMLPESYSEDGKLLDIFE